MFRERIFLWVKEVGNNRKRCQGKAGKAGRGEKKGAGMYLNQLFLY